MHNRHTTAPHSLLGFVSLAQLGCGLTGLVVAVRRGHAFDIPVFGKGSPRTVARDSLVTGTALSAPGPMLVAQALWTAKILSRPDRRAAMGLHLLGAAQVGGYIAERLVRRRLARSGWDPLETPLAVTGVSLAAAMALLRPPAVSG